MQKPRLSLGFGLEVVVKASHLCLIVADHGISWHCMGE